MTSRPAPPPPPSGGGKPKQTSSPAPAKQDLILAPREKREPTPRLVVNAVEGWGKTTLGAYAPDPAIIMAGRETGYDTLLSADLVPQVPAVAVEDWKTLLAWLDTLAEDPQGRKTIVLDALGGLERLCHEHVCERDYGGEWGETGFSSFQQGYDVAVADWLSFLARLDRLQREQGMVVVLLSHCKVSKFNNPAGNDFDRYVADVHHKTWSATHRWADAVLFGQFHSIVETDRSQRKRGVHGKGKGIGGTERVLYTQRRDAWDAKNRYAMPEEIWMPEDPGESWNTVWNAIVGGE